MTNEKELNPDDADQFSDLMERAKREYFQTNPETKPYDSMIRFYINGNTVSIDDSRLPADIAAIVEKRNGKKLP